jgi:hypothetical protein
LVCASAGAALTAKHIRRGIRNWRGVIGSLYR